MIEVLITLGIFILVSTIGVVISISSYQRVNFRTDLATSATMLQKARSASMSNVGESAHGVYFDDANKRFVLFRGTSYAARVPAYDVAVGHGKALGVTPTNSSVVFTQLSGGTSDLTLTFNDGVRSGTIEINKDGGINW